MLCRQHLAAQDAAKSIAAIYDDCPTHCPSDKKRPYDVERFRFCEACPKKKGKDELKRKTLLMWEKQLGEKATDLNFDSMLSALLTIKTFDERSDEKLTVKSGVLLGIYRHIRWRHKEATKDKK